jgi:hypothetical protein
MLMLVFVDSFLAVSVVEYITSTEPTLKKHILLHITHLIILQFISEINQIICTKRELLPELQQVSLFRRVIGAVSTREQGLRIVTHSSV